jgi:hypothetical protein
MKMGIAGHIRSNAIAYVALFTSLTVAPAWALTQIGPKQIADDAVRSWHIKDGEVSGADVANGALSGKDIGNGALTQFNYGTRSIPGGAIQESTVGGNNLAVNTLTGREIGPGAVGTSETATRPAALGSGTVNVPDFDQTSVQLSNESFDTANMHISGSSLIHAPVDGYYLATAHADWAADSASKRATIIDKCTTNSSCGTFIASTIGPAQQNENLAQSTSAVVHLGATQSVRLIVSQDTGAALQVHGILSLIWLAP